MHAAYLLCSVVAANLAQDEQMSWYEVYLHLKTNPATNSIIPQSSNLSLQAISVRNDNY
jgi:hypothetical protein